MCTSQMNKSTKLFKKKTCVGLIQRLRSLHFPTSSFNATMLLKPLTTNLLLIFRKKKSHSLPPILLIGLKLMARTWRDLQTKLMHEIQCSSFYLCHSNKLFSVLIRCSLRPYLGFKLKIMKSEEKINTWS